jgi:hypothetical protein
MVPGVVGVRVWTALTLPLATCVEHWCWPGQHIPDTAQPCMNRSVKLSMLWGFQG